MRTTDEIPSWRLEQPVFMFQVTGEGLMSQVYISISEEVWTCLICCQCKPADTCSLIPYTEECVDK